MAAPTFVQAGTGVTDAGGAFSVSGSASAAGGNVLICQVLQDGSTSGAVGASFSGGSQNLAGTASSMTFLGEFAVGSPTAAYQHLWIGRSPATGNIPAIFGTNSTSEDVYVRWYEFTSVNTGTATSDVLENGTAGTTVNGVGTSTTCSDTGVTTLGADRLALNFVAINDDLSGLAAFAGESGGDWTLATAIYEDAGGTDGTIALMQAGMASAGTINGDSDSISNLAWGVVGFALIGTTVAAPATKAIIYSPQFERQQYLRVR